MKSSKPWGAMPTRRRPPAQSKSPVSGVSEIPVASTKTLTVDDLQKAFAAIEGTAIYWPPEGCVEVVQESDSEGYGGPE